MTLENRILVICGAGHFLTHMNVLIFPAVVMPLTREMGLPLSHVFPMGFFMYFFYGAMALPAGYIADRWSRVAVIRLCICGMSLSSIAAGLSTTQTTFTISMASLGLFSGLYHPAGLGLIAQGTDRQGRGHGINGAIGNLGLACAPILAGLVMMALPWRWVYFISGIIGFIAFLAMFLISIDEKSLIHSHQNKNNGGANGYKYIKYFAMLCVIMTIGGFTYRANMTALPALFELKATELLQFFGQLSPASSRLDATSGIAAMIVGSLFVFSMMGQYTGGRLADRIDLRIAYILFHSLSIPFALAMYFLTESPIYVAAAGLVFFNLGVQPIENSLVSKFIPKKWVSTGYGMKFTLTFGLGSFAVYQVSMVENWWGLAALYPILCVQAGFMAILALILCLMTKNIPLMTIQAPIVRSEPT